MSAALSAIAIAPTAGYMIMIGAAGTYGSAAAHLSHPLRY